MKRTLRSNILLSVVAQVISLCASFLLGLILPKYVEISQYAYWQTFLLYSSYVGILHFGLIDGIVLRYSQYDYEKLDKPLIRSQLVWLLVFTSSAAVLCLFSSFLITDKPYKIICLFVGVNIIISNLLTFTTYTYQITNEIPKYISVIIIERVSNIIIVLLLLLAGIGDFYWFCIAQILGSCFGVFFAIYKSRDLFFGSLISKVTSVTELKNNISAGAKLLAANWSAMFIVGGAKTFIQWHWSLIIFGYVSFAFSMTNLFLSFVSSASVVLFPALKRFSMEKLNSLYPRLRMQMTVLLISMMLLYYPIEYLLPLWLPKYATSLKYFGMILPIVVFTSKLTLLTNNYLKVFRQEKAMFNINISTLILAISGYVICSYVFDSLDMIIFWTVIVIIIRAILSEMKLAKLLNLNCRTETFAELIMCILFSITLYMEHRVIGFFLFLSALVIYIVLIFAYPQRRQLLMRI